MGLKDYIMELKDYIRAVLRETPKGRVVNFDIGVIPDGSGKIFVEPNSPNRIKFSVKK